MLPRPLLKNIDFPFTKASPLLVDGWTDGWRRGRTDAVVVMRLSRHEDDQFDYGSEDPEASCMKATKHCIIAWKQGRIHAISRS